MNVAQHVSLDHCEGNEGYFSKTIIWESPITCPNVLTSHLPMSTSLPTCTFPKFILGGLYIHCSMVKLLVASPPREGESLPIAGPEGIGCGELWCRQLTPV